MSGISKLFRRLRTLLWTALTLVTIVAAILVGVGKLLMPYSVRYQPQLEEWLSEEFQQPVEISSFTGEWKAFGPRISLEGLSLQGQGDGREAIAIQRAALDIRPLNFLLPGRPSYTFRIIGADMALWRTSDGRFELSGLGVSGRGRGDSGSSGLRNLASVGEVRLEDSSLSFDDDARGIHVQLTGVQGRLQIDGERLAADVEASVSDGRRTRVLGDFMGTVLITLGDDQRLAAAEWHVKTRELMISELALQVPAHPLVPLSGWLNAEVWGEWSRGSNQVMQGVIDLRESTLSAEPRLLRLEHLNTRFHWNLETRKSWKMDLSDLTVDSGEGPWTTPNMSIARNIPGKLGIWISSDFIDMEFPMQVTQRVMASYNTTWPRSMPRQSRGQMRDFDLVLDDRWKLFMVRGRFENTDAWDWDRWPDVAGIRGTIDLYGGEGELGFTGEDVRLDWPRNFRRQAVVDIPECTMEILWGANRQWQIDARDCILRNENFEMYGRSRFAKSEGRPALDINLVVTRAELDALDDYWPESVMRPNVTGWLRRGLVAGRAENVRFSMRGDMDDWPFRDNQGLLEAWMDVSDLDLDYVPGWPRALGMDGRARFLNTSMDASGTVQDIGGVPVESFAGRVGDFKQPVLELEYSGAAPLPDMLGFIRRTPLLDKVDLDLDRFGFSGDARTDGTLTAPLRAGSGTLQIDGRLRLDGNGFTEHQSGVQLEGITGVLGYDREGVRGSGLDAAFRDNPTKLSLAADWDAEELFRADLAGSFAVDDVIPGNLLEGEPLLDLVEGACDWDVNLTVSGADDAAGREVWLEMRSGLEGVAFRFPTPLEKPAAEPWPLTVRYPVQSAQPIFSIEARDRLLLQFDIPDGLANPIRAGIALGEGSRDLPEVGLFGLSGSVTQFDLDNWMALVIERFRQERGAAGLKFQAADLRAAELLFLDREFENVGMSVSFEDDILAGSFDSERLAGTVRYTRSDDGSHSLAAGMDRLLLPAPVSEGMSMSMNTDPSELPEMHLYAREFSYLGLEMGETRIEAYPVQNGFRIESVEAHSQEFSFQARGDWISDEEGERSDFDIVMTSESLGSLMNSMEISSVLQGGQTMLHYDAWWPGPPAAFALARLNGEVEFSVIGGNIRNADAGAGRIVGLLSVTALPRRLALDFRDVFGSGFSFDQAGGSVLLENGTAHTDNLVLESTAATMAIAGSSDLVNREFDYTLSVRPGVGQTLPVLGAIAGGPGGAAAGLALQGLLQKSLGEAAEARYSISGQWQDPVVERLNAPVAAAEQPGDVDG